VITATIADELPTRRGRLYMCPRNILCQPGRQDLKQRPRNQRPLMMWATESYLRLLRAGQ
jgi:hypothetical protein